ncbi:MAG: hypothetical protein WAM91_06685 [Candidatus Acidiferrales bacterium]
MYTRIALVSMLIGCVSPILGQSPREADPYLLHFVAATYAMRLQDPSFTDSSFERNIVSLGDGLAIAILKNLDDSELMKPRSAEAVLSLIQRSFSHPEAISIEVDRKPRITMLLLERLQKLKDPAIRKQVGETIVFVQQRTKLEGS